MRDAKKMGRNRLPVHRKAMISPSSASKDSVLLDFRPLRTCRVWLPGWTGNSIVSFISTDPARSPSITAMYAPRRTSAPIALCVNFSVAATVDLVLFLEGVSRRAQRWV
ncbi:MAG TPA: hypothetical protein VFC03_01110, partial [Acidimicrobiales bacterium]|nr:hypothetical protein [Acidimicrobiales bacterium]